MAFRHKRLSLLLAFHFRPISSERTYSYYPILIHPPLFRVISITMSPSHHTTRHIVLSTSVAFVSIRLDRRFPFRYL